MTMPASSCPFRSPTRLFADLEDLTLLFRNLVEEYALEEDPAKADSGLRAVQTNCELVQTALGQLEEKLMELSTCFEMTDNQEAGLEDVAMSIEERASPFYWYYGCVMPPLEGRFGSIGSSHVAHFHYPCMMATDSDGQIYIADHRNWRVQVFDAQLGFVRSITLNVQPLGVAVTKDYLFVSDKYQHIISMIDKRTKAIANSWQSFAFPCGVTVSPTTGDLMVANASSGKIIAVRADGGQSIPSHFGHSEGCTYNLEEPYALAWDHEHSHLFVTDARACRVVVFTAKGDMVRAFGSRGHQPGQFGKPLGLAISEMGFVYVADFLSKRVQVFDRHGHQQRTITRPDFGKLVGVGINEAASSSTCTHLLITDEDNHCVHVVIDHH